MVDIRPNHFAGLLTLCHSVLYLDPNNIFVSDCDTTKTLQSTTTISNYASSLKTAPLVVIGPRCSGTLLALSVTHFQLCTVFFPENKKAEIKQVLKIKSSRFFSPHIQTLNCVEQGRQVPCWTFWDPTLGKRLIPNVSCIIFPQSKSVLSRETFRPCQMKTPILSRNFVICLCVSYDYLNAFSQGRENVLFTALLDFFEILSAQDTDAWVQGERPILGRCCSVSEICHHRHVRLVLDYDTCANGDVSQGRFLSLQYFSFEKSVDLFFFSSRVLGFNASELWHETKFGVAME